MDARPLSRRAVLLGLAGVAGTGVVGAAGRRAGWFSGPDEPMPPATVQRWRERRGERYLVAHRGSGDVLPEHTLPAYRAARGWGAGAMEVSVAMTSDGVLVCMHDLSYDRTTNRTGRIAALPSSVLADVRVVQPQLGPAWTEQPPAVPRLDAVLTELGGSMVLCLEAKDDAAYVPMLGMVEALGLRDSVVVKAYRSSGRIEQARAAGYPLFAYLGTDDLAPAATAALAGRLRPDVDHLGMPTTGSAGPVSDEVVRDCVSHGVPVWAYPVHRRSEAARFSALGVAGVVCSSYGYVAGVAPRLAADTWRTRRIAGGELTRSPADPALAPAWTGADELTLGTGEVQFVTLGQLAPLERAAGSYVITLQARWPQAPVDPAAEVSLVVGHADDRHYEPGLGTSTGYDAVVRADGGLELRAHVAGSRLGRVLASTTTAPPVPGEWLSLQLAVTPSTLTWARTGGGAAPAVARDARARGGYLHLGRTGAPASFRALSVG